MSRRPRFPSGNMAHICLLAIALAASVGRMSTGSAMTASQNAGAVPRGLKPGAFLIAARTINDGNFAQTVVFLFAYGARDGAGGLVINRPSSVPLRQVLSNAPPGPDGRLFVGGPVARPERRGLWHAPLPQVTTSRVLPDVALLDSPDAIDAAVDAGATNGRLRIYTGYAGWSPGQLEREIQRGDWHIRPGDSAMIFASEPSTVWPRLIRLTDVMAL